MANLVSDNVSVISTATNTVTATIPVGNSPFGIAFATVAPQGPIDALIAQVEALFAGGSLTQNQRDTLIAKLEEIRAKIAAGQTNAAINQLSAFLNQLSALVNNGTLTQAQAQSLIDGATALQNSLAPVEISSCTTIKCIGVLQACC